MDKQEPLIHIIIYRIYPGFQKSDLYKRPDDLPMIYCNQIRTEIHIDNTKGYKMSR